MIDKERKKRFLILKSDKKLSLTVAENGSFEYLVCYIYIKYIRMQFINS